MREKLVSLHHRSKLTQNSKLKTAYKDFKKDYSKQLLLAKNKFNAEFINTATNKSKAAWMLIKQETSSNIPHDIPIRPNILNNHFVTITENILTEVQQPQCSPLTLLNNLKLSKKIFKWAWVTHHEIIKIVKGFKSSKTRGAYGLTNELVKHLGVPKSGGERQQLDATFATPTFPHPALPAIQLQLDSLLQAEPRLKSFSELFTSSQGSSKVPSLLATPFSGSPSPSTPFTLSERYMCRTALQAFSSEVVPKELDEFPITIPVAPGNFFIFVLWRSSEPPAGQAISWLRMSKGDLLPAPLAPSSSSSTSSSSSSAAPSSSSLSGTQNTSVASPSLKCLMTKDSLP
ncbi:hypothetical protein J437_LFUL010565 [Ladona fulva]|uniref:Uncharacterized protein n=1 Tax=Ladona fulva TaxID=123851 RepID=A0A8K0KDW9_LADFU|nr:hypothetical protein J437_LFUL010565 [Ladona fulva]